MEDRKTGKDPSMRLNSAAPAKPASGLAELMRLARAVTCAAVIRTPEARARLWSELNRRD